MANTFWCPVLPDLLCDILYLSSLIFVLMRIGVTSSWMIVLLSLFKPQVIPCSGKQGGWSGLMHVCWCEPLVFILVPKYSCLYPKTLTSCLPHNYLFENTFLQNFLNMLEVSPTADFGCAGPWWWGQPIRGDSSAGRYSVWGSRVWHSLSVCSFWYRFCGDGRGGQAWLDGIDLHWIGCMTGVRRRSEGLQCACFYS